MNLAARAHLDGGSFICWGMHYQSFCFFFKMKTRWVSSIMKWAVSRIFSIFIKYWPNFWNPFSLTSFCCEKLALFRSLNTDYSKVKVCGGIAVRHGAVCPPGLDGWPWLKGALLSFSFVWPLQCSIQCFLIWLCAYRALLTISPTPACSPVIFLTEFISHMFFWDAICVWVLEL